MQSILPPSLREQFTMPSTLLMLIFSVSILSSVLLAGVFLTQQVTDLAQLERVKQARRLRYAASGKEVKLLPIEAHQFHLFLSHAWKDAQDQSASRRRRLQTSACPCGLCARRPARRVDRDAPAQCV